METVTVKMSREDYDSLPDLHNMFTLKSVDIKDDFFKHDEIHEKLQKESIKAYKKLKEYEFTKRHNI